MILSSFLPVQHGLVQGGALDQGVVEGVEHAQELLVPAQPPDGAVMIEDVRLGGGGRRDAGRSSPGRRRERAAGRPLGDSPLGGVSQTDHRRITRSMGGRRLHGLGHVHALLEQLAVALLAWAVMSDQRVQLQDAVIALTDVPAGLTPSISGIWTSMRAKSERSWPGDPGLPGRWHGGDDRCPWRSREDLA